VATSDYVGYVLRTIYELLFRNMHTILNGVNEHAFHPNSTAGAAFRAKYDVSKNASSWTLASGQGSFVAVRGFWGEFEEA
jgi:hypothetical protein